MNSSADDAPAVRNMQTEKNAEDAAAMKTSRVKPSRRERAGTSDAPRAEESVRHAKPPAHQAGEAAVLAA